MPPARKSKRIVTAIVAVVVLLFLSSGLSYVRTMIGNKPQSQKRQVPVVVKLIRPPEPPPEPPPPPPPEKHPEEVLQETPEDKPIEQAPESAQLGVDAEGSAGGDSFGLVGHAGGRDLVGSGSGPFVFYASMVKDLVQDALANVDRARRGKYSILVRVWIANDGRIERASLVESTGNHELDGAIEKALNQTAKVREAPPLEMPQPITLKIVSRG